MPDIDFHGRVAIVTGAGNGLGRDYALALAARGAAVVVNDLGGGTDGRGGAHGPADAVVADITAAGGRAVAHYESVASEAGGASLVASALEHFGRVDIVINNAGNQRNGRFEEMSVADFDAVLDVHLRGAFFVSRPAFRAMSEQGYGRFVFTSSSSGILGNYIRANYASAKAGLVGLMHSVALEGAEVGVVANALLPCAASRLGATPPGALKPEWEADDPRHKDGIELVGPAIAPEWVTPLVLFLASEQCTSTHGIYSALGGRYARCFIGVTEGWLAPAGTPPAPEDIAANLDRVEDRTVFFEPQSVGAEFDPVIAARRAAT